LPAKTYSTCLKTLGESYLAEGDKTEAKKYYGTYLDLTEPLGLKNIFIQRSIKEIKKALESM
jgi:hypothetical protein